MCIYYCCNKSGHMKSDWPKMKAQGTENAQAQASSPNANALKKNCVYVLRSRGNQEDSPDVVTSMLLVFFHYRLCYSRSWCPFIFYNFNDPRVYPRIYGILKSSHDIFDLSEV